MLDLWIGRIIISSQKTMRLSTRCKEKRSHLEMIFVPSTTFWQTIIHLQLEWIARLDSFIVPMLSLQFLDVVQDNCPIISASIHGDLKAIEKLLSSQAVSPLCSTISGWTPLHFAAAYGHLGASQLLMAQGAPLNATGFRGITPLHLAAHFGRYDVFKALLKAGSDPDTYHEHGLNATLEFLSSEMVSSLPDLADSVKWLLHGQDQYLLDIQARDNSERGILYHLAYPPGWSNTDHSTRTLTTSQTELITLVLRDGGKCDELDVHGISLLHEACRDGRLDLVTTLLSERCSINAVDDKGYTPLHYAVENRSFEVVSTLVAHGANINVRANHDCYQGWMWSGHPTPIYLAAKLNWLGVVPYLIQHGAGHEDRNISDAFHVATASLSFEVVQYLIQNNFHQLDLRNAVREAGFDPGMIEILYKAGASLNESSEHDWTPLAWAVLFGEVDAVKKLVELGADIDKMSRGLTPLGHAARNGRGDVAHILITAGAQTELTGTEMSTPWQLAISGGFNEIADKIAQTTETGSSQRMANFIAKVAVEARVEESKVSFSAYGSLTEAAINGDLATVEKLIEQGCGLNAKGSSLWSPLHLAISWQQWAVATKLIEAGAELNLNHRNDDGTLDMPFMAAVRNYNVAFIELMILHGANVNLCDKEGSSPLLRSLDFHLSYREGTSRVCYTNSDVVRLLLNAGAGVNVIDDFGRTPLGKAAAIGNLGAVVALVEAGANMDEPSSQNSDELISRCELVYRTPLSWAALGSHEDVVKLLFDRGADWRSLPKDPALTYTHRVLMQSWFPKDAEPLGDAVSGVDLLSVPSGKAVGETDTSNVVRAKG